MSDAWDDEERAIARALDAGTDVDTGGADQQLVDSYREVLAELPLTEITPRPDLEDRVVAAAIARRRAAVPVLRPERPRRHNRIRLAALAATAVAAAIVVGIIVRGGSTGPSTPRGSVSLATQRRADVDALVRAPGARTAEFANGAGRVVIGADGRSAVYELDSPRPVSISLVSAGGTTTLGPATPASGIVAFTVDHPERVTAVALVQDGAEIARVALRPS